MILHEKINPEAETKSLEALLANLQEVLKLSATETKQLYDKYSSPEAFAELSLKIKERATELKLLMAEMVAKVGDFGSEALFILTGLLEMILSLPLFLWKNRRLVVTVLVMAAILMSCAGKPATATQTASGGEPTTISAPATATFEPATATTIASPSPMPFTETPIPSPTPEDTTAKDYLAKTENVFPIPEVDGLGEFTCTADFGNIDYQVYTAEDGTTKVYATIPCPDGGVDFIIPGLFTNKDISLTPLGMNATQTNDGGDYNWFGNAPETTINQILDILKAKGKKVKVKILIGTNTGSILKFADPFPQIFAGTQWDEGIKKFMRTGNPKDLPKLPGRPGYFLPAARITIIP